jgi:uncharacterized protein YegL
MIILLDESASMQGTKWDSSVAALDAFLADPASAGIAVGLGVFPVTGTGPSVCDQTKYQQLLVPLGTLPQSEATLVAAIAGESPQGDTTPLNAALEGGLWVATHQKATSPDHTVVVVLATDGMPTCVTVNDIPLTQAASQALASGVMTFTIAMQGADTAQLNAIAQAGGTGQVYDLTTNVQQFSKKLDQIRAQALPCDVVIPPPPQGDQLDPTRVNVVYTPGGGAMPEEIPHAQSAAACGSDPGWYYDDDAAPTKVILCPASCTTVKGDVDASIDVAFGCQTILK